MRRQRRIVTVDEYMRPRLPDLAGGDEPGRPSSVVVLVTARQSRACQGGARPRRCCSNREGERDGHGEDNRACRHPVRACCGGVPPDHAGGARGRAGLQPDWSHPYDKPRTMFRDRDQYAPVDNVS
jgi:hypothetical protein